MLYSYRTALLMITEANHGLEIAHSVDYFDCMVYFTLTVLSSLVIVLRQKSISLGRGPRRLPADNVILLYSTLEQNRLHAHQSQMSIEPFNGTLHTFRPQ